MSETTNLNEEMEKNLSEEVVEEVEQEVKEETVTDSDEVAEDSEKPIKRTMEKRKKKILIAVGATVLALGVIYAGGRAYFAKHYFPKTTINGVETGNQEAKEAVKTVADHLATYKLKVHSVDGDMTVTADQVGLKYEDTESVDKLLKKQNINSWFVEAFKEHKYKAMKTALDDEKLSKTIDGLDCMNPKEVRKSERARIRYDKDQKKYVIKEATVGNQVVKDEFMPAMKKSILAGEKTLDMTTNEYYKQPRYTSTSEKVIKAKEKVDKYMKTVITLKDGKRSIKIGGEQIHNFIKISNDYKVTLKKDTIYDYVQDSVWKKMNTTEKARIIDSPGSGMFYVVDDSDAKVVRVRTETEQIMKDIKKGKSVTRKPDYMTDFMVSDYGDIVGDNYVEVSIGGQHVWAIQDGKVVLSTPVVTGNVSTGHASPTGIYTVKWKTTNYTMRKYNAHVNYWMPYDTQQGIGFHDATWRGSFGGSIYYYSGSHGCINMPYSAARSLYYIVDKGWPVIVH